MSEGDDALNRDHRLVAERWLLIANRDIRSAEACLDAPVPIPETAAYHCQQAAEKLMKELLVVARIPFRKTYDLEALRDLVVPNFPSMSDTIDLMVPLTDWGHVFRYPDLGGEAVPSPDELRGAVREVKSFAERVTVIVGSSEG